MSADAPKVSTKVKTAAGHVNVYDKSAAYAGLAVPTVSFGSTKGRHVQGNPTTTEVHLSTSYQPLRARRLAKAAKAAEKAATAGKKDA